MKKIILATFIFTILGACTRPSESAIQTAIASTQNVQTSTQNAQLVLTPTDTSINDCDVSSVYREDWTTVFCDTFDDNLNYWDLGGGSDELSRSLFQIENGKFVADLTGKATSGYLSGVIQWMNILPARNFMITITGDIFSNYKSCSWGIVFNQRDSDNFYALMLSSRDGWYNLIQFENGKQKFPISTRPHSAINWDEQNELTIVAEDGYYQFYINNQLVNDYKTRPETAYLSLAIWTAEGVTARFEFDDLLIRVPDQEVDASIFPET
ncbi:MAG: hypothetical protein GYA18_11930 [Chloroflexi bacterium]|nr:hypothetical protein [Chloroflexota bacterium]